MVTTDSFFDEMSTQSEVKAAIVRKYFSAWSKIMVRRANRIAYVDLFAGPGRYKDGKISTPLQVLQAAVVSETLSQKLITLFNDKDPDAAGNLKDAIASLDGVENLRYSPKVFSTEIDTEVAAMFEDMSLVPTLFFVDPWGYKGLSLRLINAVLKDWGCDCIFFFNYNRINMGVPNQNVRQHIIALFGETRALELATALDGLSPDAREYHIVNELAEALSDSGKRYVIPFRFRNASGKRTSHHLIFVTKNVLGYSIMKDIMSRESSSHEDGVASFEYSPVNDPQLKLLFAYARRLDELGDDLMLRFAGQSMTMIEIYEQHHVGTPYVKSNYKEALRRLEAEGAIACGPPQVSPRRRKGTFADAVRVTFPDNGIRVALGP